LLLELLGYRAAGDGAPTTPAQAQAMTQLDQWDGPSYDRARAALDHLDPEQSAYVFDGLSAKTGAD
jgi:hypothetical protein